jgi:hypothetical protein
VKERGSGLSIGTNLAGGRAQRIGCLERVPALSPFAAHVAVTDVDTELADQRLTRDLGLELLGYASLDESAPTVRASIGELGFVALGNWFRWRWSVAVGAVSVARLATGCFRIGLGWSFAKRSPLAFAGADGLFQLPSQFRDLSSEFGNLFVEFPATGTRRLVHTEMLPHQPLFNCAGGREGR